MKVGLALTPFLLITLLASQTSLGAEINTKQVVEYKIAGLRPGRDTIERAYRRFHKSRMVKELSAPHSAVWLDPCNHQMLTVAFDAKGIIRDITVQRYPSEVDCAPKAYKTSVRARMGSTGRGLIFGDSCERIQRIYGSPQSQRRSAHGDEELIYHFDGEFKGDSLLFSLPVARFVRLWQL